ncbi:pyruvate kinase [Dendrosporobacter sp. 1207_IL3150]|uniref:pyruvate kinase n=1 Tax=Dendrosporobacter sp. 1207_IL3150 TaxID=3084054 RepID=UPI002FD9D976
MKKTKIVCTMGPSTESHSTLEQMLIAGMNVARCNFSHGLHEEHAKRITAVRAASRKVNKPVALMLDTKGPEMRLGNFAKGKVQLIEGKQFILTARDVVGTEEIASVNHKQLYQEISPGNIILLSDGLVSLKVEKIEDQDIVTTILNSGIIGDRKRVAAPGVSVNLPPLSEQDIADILFGVEQKMDFIAASFIQRAADVLAIRKLLEDASYTMDIISKIENVEGVKNIDEIIKVSDGIMVARGDLGVEIPVEEVPIIQKMMIEKCNKAGKPVITATQMLESMINNPRPTRAEASDVANAILDGTDAIMLSGETASGDYPVQAVETMAKIALRTESSLKYSELLLNKGIIEQCTTTDAISHATVQIGHELGAAAIITSSEGGYTARMVSKYRPKATILAVTPDEKALRRMLLLWGVFPVLGARWSNTDEMIAGTVETSMGAGIVRNGDLVVVTAGVPLGLTGTTNMIKVHVVGDVLVRGIGIGQSAASGRVCKQHKGESLAKIFEPGDIIVTKSLTNEDMEYAVKAAALIVEEGGITSPAAIVGVSYGIPVLVGADGAVSRLSHGLEVTVDATRGVVYNGKANAR